MSESEGQKFRVICSTLTATSPINGVEFTADRDQLISGPLAEEQAAGFRGIPGYQVVPVDAETAPQGPGGAKPEGSSTVQGGGDSNSSDVGAAQ